MSSSRFNLSDRLREFLPRSSVAKDQARPASGKNRAKGNGSIGKLLIAELAIRYITWATEHFVSPDTGEPTAEVERIRTVLRQLWEFCGSVPIDEFDLITLARFREYLRKLSWTSRHVDRSIDLVVEMLRWSATIQLVTSREIAWLTSAEKAPKSTAASTKPFRGVSDKRIAAATSGMKQGNRDLVELVRLTGALPRQLCALRPCDIDATGDVWKAALPQQEKALRGDGRSLWIGPKSQQILKCYLAETNAQDRLFPVAAAGIQHAIYRGCHRAGVKAFTPGDLHYSTATKIRKKLGLEHAKAWLRLKLCHTVLMSADSLERADSLAREAALRFG